MTLKQLQKRWQAKTGEVARNAGCHAILCELNPEYVGLIEKRLEQGSLLV